MAGRTAFGAPPSGSSGWGRPVRLLLDVGLWAGLLGLTAVVVVRLLGLDEQRHTVAVLALTPYALGAALVALLGTLVLRRASAGVVAAVLVVVLGSLVLPRALPDPQPAAGGHPLVVASINLHFGDGAAAGGVVDLVREHRVDVLSLLELTPAAVAALDAQGLRELLPHRVYYVGNAASGSGAVSRYPLSQRVLIPGTVLQQPAVMVTMPDDSQVEVQLVHPVQPLSRRGNATWQQELAVLPPPRGDGTPRLLVGDFNSTLDHPPLRRLLDAGYVDAADQAGEGLRTTWPTDRGLWPPQVTIDHVLADPRCSVRSFDVVPVPGSDHRAVVAGLVLP
ncbi:MAG TPA: endonuclease/exonuclease/phosphatase family protein [Pseudonocardiaceae bacterium]